MRLPSSPRPRRPPSAPDRLVLRRVGLDDLPFYTRLHALPKVAEHLYPECRPRSPEETKAWMEYTLASYEQFALGNDDERNQLRDRYHWEVVGTKPALTRCAGPGPGSTFWGSTAIASPGRGTTFGLRSSFTS